MSTQTKPYQKAVSVSTQSPANQPFPFMAALLLSTFRAGNGVAWFFLLD
jgi:hypothetical protein